MIAITGVPITQIGVIDADAATDGQVLTADGAGGAAWTAPAGPGYLEYVALLSQSGTAAPVATVLANTLGGEVVWTRQFQGTYTGVLAGVFTSKTICFVGCIQAQEGELTYSVINLPNVNEVFLVTHDVFLTDANGPIGVTATDGMLNSTPIDIRVYP